MRVAARACRASAGILTLTSWVCVFDLTSTPISSNGPGGESVDKSTKKDCADVWLRIEMCTNGWEALEGVYRLSSPRGTGRGSRTYFTVCDSAATGKSPCEGGTDDSDGGGDGVSLNIHWLLVAI